MTIHDPTVEVSCDGKPCSYHTQTTYLGCTWYTGGYDVNEHELTESGWITIGDKHYCSERCAENPKNE